MRLLIATIVLALGGPFAFAQRATPGITIAPRPQPHPQHFRSSAFLSGWWYPGYETSTVQPAPKVIVIEQPEAPPVVKEEPKPITPLLIELRDGRYVRSDREYAASPGERINSAAKAPRPAPSEIVPALLVFRDGHRERVREYTIADGAIYARGDYWVNGYWNKKILLSELDVPATLSVNQGNGSKFELPSGPNVVVVRP